MRVSAVDALCATFALSKYFEQNEKYKEALLVKNLQMKIADTVTKQDIEDLFENVLKVGLKKND
jgi:hypothetical protein